MSYAAHLQSTSSVCKTCFIISTQSQQESWLPGRHMEELDVQITVWIALDPGNNWSHARGWMCVCDWQHRKCVWETTMVITVPRALLAVFFVTSCLWRMLHTWLSSIPRIIPGGRYYYPVCFPSESYSLDTLKTQEVNITVESEAKVCWDGHITYLFLNFLIIFYIIYFGHILPSLLTPLRFFLPP